MCFTTPQWLDSTEHLHLLLLNQWSLSAVAPAKGIFGGRPALLPFQLLKAFLLLCPSPPAAVGFTFSHSFTVTPTSCLPFFKQILLDPSNHFISTFLPGTQLHFLSSTRLFAIRGSSAQETSCTISFLWDVSWVLWLTDHSLGLMSIINSALTMYQGSSNHFSDINVFVPLTTHKGL